MVADSAVGQEYGLIVQQDGKPQQVLAKSLNLMLNYQYGLSIMVAQDLDRGAALMRDMDKSVQCVFVVLNHEIRDEHKITELGKQSVIPVLLIMPGKNMGRQRELCAEISNVYYCAWERAFSHSDEALQNIAAQALFQNGIGDLFEDMEKVSYEALQLRVEHRLKNINTLPTLPEIVMRIMRLVNDPNTTTQQLEQLLCTDPAIVMKLLQVIKSPVFSATGRQSSWTLSEIIVRLGLKKVGAIAQQIKMINSLVKPQESDFDLRRFWEHSVGTAIIADKLYMDKKLALKEEIEFNDYWIGSLLHDIGKLVLGFFFWDWFERVLEHVGKDKISFRQAEAKLGDLASHEHVGQLLAMYTNLGEDLSDAVGTHHGLRDKPSDLGCLIHMANNLCKDLDLGYLAGDRGKYNRQVLKTLNIGSDDVEELKNELAAETVGEIKARYCQMLWMKVVCPWRDGAAEESVSGRPWLISMRLF